MPTPTAPSVQNLPARPAMYCHLVWYVLSFQGSPSNRKITECTIRQLNFTEIRIRNYKPKNECIDKSSINVLEGIKTAAVKCYYCMAALMS